MGRQVPHIQEKRLARIVRIEHVQGLFGEQIGGVLALVLPLGLEAFVKVQA